MMVVHKGQAACSHFTIWYQCSNYRGVGVMHVRSIERVC